MRTVDLATVISEKAGFLDLHACMFHGGFAWEFAKLLLSCLHRLSYFFFFFFFFSSTARAWKAKYGFDRTARSTPSRSA